MSWVQDAPAPFPPGRAPRTEAQRLDWLRLARSENVGPVTFVWLMRRFPDARSALEAIPELAARGGAKRKITPATRAMAEAEMQAGRAAGARLLCLGEPDYPPLLAVLDDPPPVLWVIGSGAALKKPGVALVGARNASALGCRLARDMAAQLAARGLCVVSGLARGIDTHAHEGALSAGPGLTVAVLAGGVDQIYPPENERLYARIAAEGALMSEMPMGTEPQARLFPRRNRLVSGLAHGVVVIEAAERSGSLITARYATDQGREALAVPGNPLDPRAGGCNLLIREGATLVRGAEDVIEALNPRLSRRMAEPPRAWADDAPPTLPDIDALRERVHGLLGTAPVAQDELIRQTGAPPAAVVLALLELDLAGRLTRHPGNLVSRADW